MKRATGIGGIFIQSADPERLYSWYERHLGIAREEPAGAMNFRWRSADDLANLGSTVFAIFAKGDDYFAQTTADHMINFRVENLDALLDQLRAEGVSVDDRREEYEYGRFAWIVDPDGRRIELWEPAPEH